jgi:cell division protein ZapA (FtsZ GTPase activity inhibitor)
MMRTVKITVRERDYWIKTDLEEEEVRQVVKYLESVIDDLSEKMPEMPEEKLLVLAALNIAFDLFQEKKKRAEEAKRLSDLAEKLEVHLK